WSFLRFLLPAFPAMLALVAAGLLRSLTWPSSWLRTWAVVLILMPFLAFRIGRPITLGIFGVWQVERRYVDTGTYVRLNMPENAVFLSMQQSGSLRYYADRLTIRWDYLEPEWLDRSIDVLKDLGLKPYFLLEEPEESYFRGRFSAASRLGSLNWKAHVQLATDPVVRIYDPDGARR
ncbi:MAG TPA: hypothetical protein VLD67_03630, partial [Vicinamibacterales bacterium]|nr:hypothetical protein [Vicinamibacterales bacterium]